MKPTYKPDLIAAAAGIIRAAETTNQHTMQRNALRAATGNMLADYVKALEKQRFQMMAEWRANGSTDEGYKAIEAFDVILDQQSAILAQSYR